MAAKPALIRINHNDGMDLKRPVAPSTHPSYCCGMLWYGAARGDDPMRRVYRALAVASGWALAACSSGSDFYIAAAPPVMTLQYESEPPGAEVKTSTNQTCRTPCALAVPAADITATYALKGFKTQIVPVKLQPPEVPRDDPNPRFTPNPVYAELEVAGPVKRPAAKPVARKPAPGTTAGAPTATSTRPRPTPAASPPAAPAPAAASPWPPATNPVR